MLRGSELSGVKENKYRFFKWSGSCLFGPCNFVTQRLESTYEADM